MKYFPLTIIIVLFCCINCGDDSTTNNSSPEVVLIFFDGFSQQPDTQWINNGSGLDLSVGNGAPSLECDTGASLSWNRLSVSPYSGTTIATDIAVLSNSSGTGKFIITDTLGATKALMWISRIGGSIQINCNGGNFTFPDDSAFHRYAFRVESNGTAGWLRDGSALYSFNNFNLNTRLRMKYTTDGDRIRYDNAAVTVP